MWEMDEARRCLPQPNFVQKKNEHESRDSRYVRSRNFRQEIPPLSRLEIPNSNGDTNLNFDE